MLVVQYDIKFADSPRNRHRYKYAFLPKTSGILSDNQWFFKVYCPETPVLLDI
jgi:hypothetical protein